MHSAALRQHRAASRSPNVDTAQGEGRVGASCVNRTRCTIAKRPDRAHHPLLSVKEHDHVAPLMAPLTGDLVDGDLIGDTAQGRLLRHRRQSAAPSS